MKKTALRKEFWMSIRKSPGRFLSIFLIVALGVSFFSGIRASEPDMRVSGDRYYDETNLMDLKVQGSLGLTDDDVKALSEVEGIRSAEGGYSVDALCKVGENEEVIHIASSYDTVNQTTVSEGRMPKGDSECVLDEDFMEANGYEIGDTIELSSGTEDPLTDSLKKEDLTIVGAGSSPEYISIERGSSLIGNGEVSAFAVVAPEAFVLDVYTEIYLLVDGAEAETCYTDGYDDLIAEVKKRVEDIADVECVRRTEEIKAEALQEIADSQSELDDAKKEADEELAKAEQELQDAEQQITDGRRLTMARQHWNPARQRSAVRRRPCRMPRLSIRAERLSYSPEKLHWQVRRKLLHPEKVRLRQSSQSRRKRLQIPRASWIRPNSRLMRPSRNLPLRKQS